MAADAFSKNKARDLLAGKRILLFGDSNMRAVYKDITWLLETGTLIPVASLRKKNERTHAGDVRLSNGRLTNSRNYEEVREYVRRAFVHYEFLTRLYLARFVQTIENLAYEPDAVVINSCLWDLARWGPDGVADFKVNVRKTMQLLKDRLPARTRVVWSTTLPPSFKCRGGFLAKDIDFVRTMLPFHVIQANSYVAQCAEEFGHDVLDLHYHMRLLIDMRSPDGIHWEPRPIRYITNLLLTHLCLCWQRRLPGNVPLDLAFVARTERNTWNANNNDMPFQPDIKGVPVTAVSGKAAKRRRQRDRRKLNRLRDHRNNRHNNRLGPNVVNHHRHLNNRYDFTRDIY